jgi:hypothetical protein
MALSCDYEGPRSSGFRGTAENAKTKLCMGWANGECRFGEKCNFAHGEHELRRLNGTLGNLVYGNHNNQDFLNIDEKTNKIGHDSRKSFYSNCVSNIGYSRSTPFTPIHGPNGWTEYHDPATGDQYYHNHNTNKTQWERPIEWPNSYINARAM